MKYLWFTLPEAIDQVVFRERFKDYGVFYPLQTMTKDEVVDMLTVPFCIDGNSKAFKNSLIEIANSISRKVYEITDDERKWLHLSAVLMNNNINHLMLKIKRLLEFKKLPEEILYPLLIRDYQKGNRYEPF